MAFATIDRPALSFHRIFDREKVIAMNFDEKTKENFQKVLRVFFSRAYRVAKTCKDTVNMAGFDTAAPLHQVLISHAFTSVIFMGRTDLFSISSSRIYYEFCPLYQSSKLPKMCFKYVRKSHSRTLPLLFILNILQSLFLYDAETLGWKSLQKKDQKTWASSRTTYADIYLRKHKNHSSK